MMNPTLQRIEQALDEKVKQHTPDTYQDFKNAVLAGDKIMFDKNANKNLELVKNPESRKDPVNTVAKGIAGLMWLMYQQSKQSMDLAVIIQAGYVLMLHAIDFAERGLGITFDNTMIEKCGQTLAYILMQRLGIDENQLAEAIRQGQAEVQQSKQQPPQ